MDSVAGGGAPGPPRSAHYRLSIEFEARPGSGDIARLSESTVFINTAHPAHQRAEASRAEGYHAALAVAVALAPEALECQRISVTGH